jgi:hypothetical protein
MQLLVRDVPEDFESGLREHAEGGYALVDERADGIGLSSPGTAEQEHVEPRKW